jgi:hypothetical protein
VLSVKRWSSKECGEHERLQRTETRRRGLQERPTTPLHGESWIAENEALRDSASTAVVELNKAAAWICREVEAGTKSATHWAIRLGNNAKALEAATGKDGINPSTDTPEAAPGWTTADESSAKAIYEQWANLCGYVPWVEGGNSLKQDEARRMHAAIEGKDYCHGR